MQQFGILSIVFPLLVYYQDLITRKEKTFLVFMLNFFQVINSYKTCSLFPLSFSGQKIFFPLFRMMKNLFLVLIEFSAQKFFLPSQSVFIENQFLREKNKFLFD